jgi:undecaprenyl pyrophosphate phosphatase UppP
MNFDGDSKIEFMRWVLVAGLLAIIIGLVLWAFSGNFHHVPYIAFSGLICMGISVLSINIRQRKIQKEARRISWSF